MIVPDVLALELEKAKSLCLSAGLETEVVFTKAPGSTSEGKLRVLRLEQVSQGKVLLTVAREDKGFPW